MRQSALAAGCSCLLAILISCTDERPDMPTGPTMAAPPRAVTFDLSSAFDSYVFLPFVLDDGGPNDNPAQSDLNSFSRADNVDGKLGVAWTWDDINSWTGSGQTGDACALFDTDATPNGLADYAVCVRITNTADGSQILQLPDGQSPQIYECSDKKTDRCTQPSPPKPLGTTFCEVTKTTEAFALGDDGQDVLAACAIDLAVIGNATKTNILNVCSFPSGAPNSNAFDCVVTPGAGFLRIEKQTTPDNSGQTFTFTLNPAATSGTTSFSLTDADAGVETTGLVPVSPGTYKLTEGALPAGWLLDAASCVRGTTATGARSGNEVTGIAAGVGETTVCRFHNVVASPTLTVEKTASPTSLPETGGLVTYTVAVKNTSTLSVTLTQLTDDQFGDLAGKNTCATGGTIVAGATYSCSFTEQLPAATKGATHVNIVTAKVTNAGGESTATDDATVSYEDVAPTLTVLKVPSVNSVPETGGLVTYTVTVTNTSSEIVTLTALGDNRFDIFGAGSTCALNGTIQPGANYQCSFAGTVAGAPGDHVNIVSATVKDDDDSEATATANATVAITNVAPTITVTKVPSPSSVPEPGAAVTFTVTVTNGSTEDVTLTALSDDKFDDIFSPPSTCALNGTIEAGKSYTCAFTRTVSGEPGNHVNIITAKVKDDENTEASNTGTATVAITNVLPTLSVTKTPNVTTVPETGGPVTYTVKVKNTSVEAVTLVALSDDTFAIFDAPSTCELSVAIAPGATYECTFTRTVSGEPGSHVNTVSATVRDNDGSEATDTGSATVTIADAPPTLQVKKTPLPASVPETGGSVKFTVEVKNTSAEPVTLSALSDDAFTITAAPSTCATGATIAPGGTYSCDFTRTVAGQQSTTHVNTVSATVEDDDGTKATGTAMATVTFTDVLPDITVTKAATPTSLSTVGGGGLGNFIPDRTFTSGNPPPPNTFQFVSPTCDDAGPNDQPAQVDLNCFNRADNVSGKIGVKWSWDDINSWTGSGQTGDGCALFDTDNDGNANVAVCARITNNSTGTQVLQVPSAGAADVYVCNDTKPDRCAKQITTVANILTTTCAIATVPDAFQGQGDDNADVEATCSIDRGMQGLTGIANVDLLNVCSFPSGEPNSNPFDCVVAVGAGFVQIIKAATPSTTQLFGFVLSPSATDGTSKYAVQGGVTSGLIPVTPRSDYSLMEVLPGGWAMTNVSCAVDGAATGTKNVAEQKITGILVKTGQTTVCTFTNSGAITGDVTYTITVTNNSLEAVTLFSLEDDKFGNLNGLGGASGVSACATGGTIAAKATYTCAFVKTLTGAVNTQHTNVVTAVGKDNDGNSDTETATATVFFGAAP